MLNYKTLCFCTLPAYTNEELSQYLMRYSGQRDFFEKNCDSAEPTNRDNPERPTELLWPIYRRFIGANFTFEHPPFSLKLWLLPNCFRDFLPQIKTQTKRTKAEGLFVIAGPFNRLGQSTCKKKPFFKSSNAYLEESKAGLHPENQAPAKDNKNSVDRLREHS